MQVEATKLPGLLIVTPKVWRDSRGFFLESYNRKLFLENGMDHAFIQDNHARSGPAGVLRGLHFQAPPAAQAKLVWCTRGAVFDVAVDIRKGSPTFGEWVGVKLSADNFKRLMIPKGFAHGYATLTEDAEFQYKVDAYYAPDHDAGIIWNDPDIGVEWPASDPVLSEKDKTLPRLAEFDSPFTFEG